MKERERLFARERTKKKKKNFHFVACKVVDSEKAEARTRVPSSRGQIKGTMWAGRGHFS